MAEEQLTIFDLNPAENHDLVARLQGYLATLEQARSLFEGKDRNQAFRRLRTLNQVCKGIKASIATGKGLNDQVSDKDVSRFVASLKRSAEAMRSQEEADAMEAFIQHKKRLRDAYLRRYGKYARQYQCLQDVPGLEDIKARDIELLKGCGVDVCSALPYFENRRRELVAVGIFDTTQEHQAAYYPGLPSRGTGELTRFMVDFLGYLRNDGRSTPQNRLNRIASNAALFGFDFQMLHPLRIDDTRQLFLALLR